MIVLYVIGALLWGYVLLALLVALRERQAARRVGQMWHAEAERRRRELENDRAELVLALRQAECIAALRRIEARQE